MNMEHDSSLQPITFTIEMIQHFNLLFQFVYYTYFYYQIATVCSPSANQFRHLRNSFKRTVKYNNQAIFHKVKSAYQMTS